jgi:GTPase-associated protein 1, N-terminal domain type 1
VTASVDQLLFGYRNGHELIAGSRSLTAGQQRDLLPHVDASLEIADSPSLVGVSVASLGAYVLARIWPAPERPRRGAVWAHALVVDADLLTSRRLTGLPALLRRPRDGELDGYERPLPWPAPVERHPSLPTALARALVWGALASGHGPRFVIRDAGHEDATDRALVALLEALPSPARRELSFRTRTRARLGASAYRLQVAATVGGRRGTAGDVVIDARRPQAGPLPEWAGLLDDGAAASHMRRDLRRYGDRDAHTLSRVTALAEVLSALGSGSDPDDARSTLWSHFPDPGELAELRLDLDAAAAQGSHRSAR